jgi:DNA-binding NarL/FixJ family response regulator
VHGSQAPYTSRARRAVVVDDDSFARRAICQLLRRAGFLVVGEGADGAEAIALAREHRPDLVLMDVRMPKLDGVAATRRIVDERPEQLVILLSGSRDDDLAVLALRVGARGYLSKDLPLDALSRALWGAVQGEAAVSRILMRHAGLRPGHIPLTRREWEVLDLMCDGRTTDEIANAFVVSRETIRCHVKRILRKLGVHSRQEAIATVRPMRSADI